MFTTSQRCSGKKRAKFTGACKIDAVRESASSSSRSSAYQIQKKSGNFGGGFRVICGGLNLYCWMFPVHHVSSAACARSRPRPGSHVGVLRDCVTIARALRWPRLLARASNLPGRAGDCQTIWTQPDVPARGCLTSLESTGPRPDAGVLLDHRVRPWSSIKTAFSRRLVFVEITFLLIAHRCLLVCSGNTTRVPHSCLLNIYLAVSLTKCRANVANNGQTIKQQWLALKNSEKITSKYVYYTDNQFPIFQP